MFIYILTKIVRKTNRPDEITLYSRPFLNLRETKTALRHELKHSLKELMDDGSETTFDISQDGLSATIKTEYLDSTIYTIFNIQKINDPINNKST